MQHIDYNLLYRWTVGLDMDHKVWEHSSFTKNRDRLLNETVARAFFGKVLGLAQWHGLVSSGFAGASRDANEHGFFQQSAPEPGAGKQGAVYDAVAEQPVQAPSERTPYAEGVLF